MIDIAPAPRKWCLAWATKLRGLTPRAAISAATALVFAEGEDGHGLAVGHRGQRDLPVPVEIVEYRRAEGHVLQFAARIDVCEHGLHGAHSGVLELAPDVSLAHGFQDAVRETRGSRGLAG